MKQNRRPALCGSRHAELGGARSCDLSSSSRFWAHTKVHAFEIWRPEAQRTWIPPSTVLELALRPRCELRRGFGCPATARLPHDPSLHLSAVCRPPFWPSLRRPPSSRRGWRGRRRGWERRCAGRRTRHNDFGAGRGWTGQRGRGAGGARRACWSAWAGSAPRGTATGTATTLNESVSGEVSCSFGSAGGCRSCCY